MQKDTKLKRGGRLPVVLSLLAALIGGMDARAQYNPPANDNLTNAQVIIGPSGSVLGNNFYATTEVGEPAPWRVCSPARASGTSRWRRGAGGWISRRTTA